MNIQFSFRRFGYVLRWTLAYQKRQLLTLFAAAVVVFVIVEVPDFVQAYHDYKYRLDFQHELQDIFIRDALRSAAGICALVGAVMLCIGAVSAFDHLHRKNEGRRLLMLPATNLEKFLARWVVYVPLLFVVFVVAFMLGDLLRMAIWPVVYDELSFPSAIPMFFDTLKALLWPMSARFPMRVLLVWAMFLFFHALSLFGGVWMGRRLGWLFVAVVFFGLVAVFAGGFSPDVTGWPLPLLVLSMALATVAAYWLFCRFPKYKLFHFKD